MILFIVFIVLAGGIAGAINAWWCFAEFPVVLLNDNIFQWYIIPAGFIHGSIFSLCIAIYMLLMKKWNIVVKILTGYLISLIAGYMSYMVLMSGVEGKIVFEIDMSVDLLFTPLQTFGLIICVYIGIDTLIGRLSNRIPLYSYALPSISGIFGSLWWWASMDYWYLSLLHGTIWGIFVGYIIDKFNKSLTLQSDIL